MNTLENPPAPRIMPEVRVAKNLSPSDVAEAMRLILGEEKRHFTSVTKIEKHGVLKVDTIRAYAQAVGVPFEEALAYFESKAQENN